MDVTPLIPTGRKIIQSYGEDGFKVSGARYTAGVVVVPTDCEGWDAPKCLESISTESLAFFLDKNIDILLLGTGRKAGFLTPSIRSGLKDAGLRVDVMDTGAACRTYNVLMAEGRRVGAALMPLK